MCMCRFDSLYESMFVPPRPDWLVFGHPCVLCCPKHEEDVGSLQEREAHGKPLDCPQPASFNTLNKTVKISPY